MSAADSELTRRFEESINAVPDRELKPRAVFRMVATSRECWVVDVTSDPARQIATCGNHIQAQALSDLLNRHADEFCGLVDDRAEESF
jgi:hypothetical protein